MSPTSTWEFGTIASQAMEISYAKRTRQWPRTTKAEQTEIAHIVTSLLITWSDARENLGASIRPGSAD